MDNKSDKKLDILIDTVKIKLVNWLKTKPTGKFNVEVNVNQGGIRSEPKISIADTDKP